MVTNYENKPDLFRDGGIHARLNKHGLLMFNPFSCQCIPNILYKYSIKKSFTLLSNAIVTEIGMSYNKNTHKNLQSSFKLFPSRSVLISRQNLTHLHVCHLQLNKFTVSGTNKLCAKPFKIFIYDPGPQHKHASLFLCHRPREKGKERFFCEEYCEGEIITHLSEVHRIHGKLSYFPTGYND